MVTQLAQPLVDDQLLIDSVVAERQNGVNAAFFNSIHHEWKMRSAGYRNDSGNPESILPWTAIAAQSGTLQNLYSAAKDGDAQKPVLDLLRERTLQLCPFCGEDGTPNTLDHFLPKTAFPEFAILPHNLFPMCDICQGDKGTKTLTVDSLRLFMHPYFDAFVSTQLVDLVISLPFTTPTMSLVPAAHLNTDQAALVSRHLHELRMVERFYHFFRNQYIRLLRLIAKVRLNGQNVHGAIDNFRFHEQLKSTNSWAHVFYAGVMSNPDLLNFLETGTLPSLL
jgi:5-methylcytosine-specific restriction endonuclease McrA